ncbi:GtrA family protein [Vagococcus fluvialis]|uniref:GtrA family protein n=1 Tax=Vagococcus fluvialis TaxID=2738 RepID=A0A7X6D9Z8_9ENTE|nr:GtrA family protein [Vagococcus fluvialis]NKC68527.1 GtrA family protein [Vagococcus fluvialis]
MKKKTSQQVNLYFLWGVVTVAFNVIIFYILESMFGMNYQLANFVDWFVTVLFAYIVNKNFVFKSKSKFVIKELILFFGTRLLSFGVEVILLWLFLGILHYNPAISKLLGHSLALIINYFLSKLIFIKY